MTVDLSPSAAARALIAQEGVDAAHDTAQRDREAFSGAAERKLAEGIVDLERSQTGEIIPTLAHGIQDAVYKVMRPWRGSTMAGSRYRYQGIGFDAAIMPDGRVRYREKDSVQLATISTTKRSGSESSTADPGKPGLGIALGDPRAYIERLRGKDPYAAERRDFLARTRALRDFLRERSLSEKQRR